MALIATFTGAPIAPSSTWSAPVQITGAQQSYTLFASGSGTWSITCEVSAATELGTSETDVKTITVTDAAQVASVSGVTGESAFVARVKAVTGTVTLAKVSGVGK